MADRRIDEFPLLDNLQDDDVILVSTGNDTYKAKISTLKGSTAEVAKNAYDKASSAENTANESASNATLALETSNEAKSESAEALKKAEESIQLSKEAQENIETVKDAVEGIKSSVENSEQSASKALEASETAKAAAQNAANAATMAGNAATLASSSATIAANAQEKVNKIEAELKEMGESTVSDVFVDDSGEKLIVVYKNGTQKEIDYSTSSGLSFDSGAVDEQGYLHLTLNGEDIENFTPFYVGTGGGGGGSAGGSSMIFAITSGMSSAVTDTKEYVSGKMKFVSTVVGSDPVVDTGPGTLQVYVNDNLIKTIMIAQGESDFETLKLIPVSMLKSDSNKIKFTVTDSYGLSATRTITVTKVNLSISWDIVGSTVKNTDSSFIVNITPVGAAGTLKTILVNVKGPNGYDETYTKNTTVSNSSSVPISISKLVEGSYVVTANCSMVYNGETINSNTLRAAIAQVGINKNCVIASPFADEKGTQYTKIAIPYRVVNGDSETATITLKALDSDDVEKFVQTLTVDSNEQIWNYKPSVKGINKLSITCGSAEWTHNIDVEPLSIKASEVTTNLDYKLEPAVLSNLSDFTLSEKFDTINGGLVVDDEGVQCIKVIKGDRLTIPYKMFEKSADANGKEIKLIYKVENCTDINATAIECKSDGIGFSINANSAEFNSALTTVDLITCEDEKTELDINVTNKQNNRLITMWEAGKPHKVVQYAVSSDKFNQETPVGITVGSDECTVLLYLIRSYSKSLSDSEILSNFIVDAPNGAEILERYNRNAIYSNGVDDVGNAVADISGSLYQEFVASNNINAHIFTISADAFPKGKSSADYISGTVNYELRSGGLSRKFARPIKMRYKLQGTSSLDYIGSAANVDINFRENIEWSDGHEQPLFKISDLSIPVDYINIKVNDASSENINNILLALWFNKFQPYIRQARADNPSVRDTVEGDMCVFFYHNSGNSVVKAGATNVEPGETILYALGNVNNSKKNTDVFAQNDEDDIVCVELNNNIDDKCRFVEGGVSGADFGDGSPYDIRYISSTLTADGTTEEDATAKLWAPAQQFVVDCNPLKATNEPLAEAVTYKINKSGQTKTFTDDTDEYRIAKFRNEAQNYFIVETLQYHYLFTLFFCMVDNRSKNLFFGYSKKTEKWNLCFGYDFDTAIGINNVGELKMSYGYLDTDHIGHNDNAGYVFNAYDSVIFDLIRKAFPEENAEMYLDLETKGCWNMEEFLNLCETYQSKFCEALWVEDFRKKYIDPLRLDNDDNYLEKGQGTKTLQRKNFVKFQQPFISSYFMSNFSRDNQATFRSYGTAQKMTVVPYSDMFVTFVGGNTIRQKRAFANEPVDIDISDFNANDTETHIRNAPFIKDIGDLSAMKMASCMFANFKKLKTIILGSYANDYENRQLTSLDVGNCIALEKLVVANCTQFGGRVLNLANNLLLKYVDTRGTNITGVTFADNGRVETALLNAIKSITAKNLKRITDIQFDTKELTSAVFENIAYSGIGDLLVNSTNIKNIRLIGVNMTIPNSALLKRLQNVKGWDAEGKEVEKVVVSGSCYVLGISSTVLAKMKAIYTDLDITYGEIIPEFTVRFMNGDEVFDIQIVERGDSAQKPSGIPTKESTVSTVYTFSGWGALFNNIIQDIDIPAVYEETVRQYTVTYMNGIVAVETQTIDYNTSCKYSGEDLRLAGTLFAGWKIKDTQEYTADGTVSNIDRDVVVTAYFVSPNLPSAKVTDYTYLASDDPNDYVAGEDGVVPAAYTWEQIYAICAQGLAKDYFELNDMVKIIPTSRDVVKDEYILFVLADFNHCRLADNEESVANTVWHSKGVLNAVRAMNSTGSNVGGYGEMTLPKWLNGTFVKQFSPLIRSIVRTVKIKSSIGDQRLDVAWSEHKFWLPSIREVNVGSSVPYKDEADELSEHAVFPIYTDNNSRIKKTFNGQGSSAYWWLRSPWATSSSSFGCIGGNGYLYNYSATSTYSVAPCFCI